MASTLSLRFLSLLPALVSAGPILVNHSSAPQSQHVLPRGDSAAGCTSSSFNGFAWAVEAFDFHASYIFTTPAHQNSWGHVNFTLANPAAGFRASCAGSSNQLQDFFYGTMPYTCTPEQGGDPAGGAKDVSNTKTTFDFSRPSGLLRVNQTWFCADEDPKYPITFRGYGAVNLTLACKDETWQNSNWTSGQVYSDREIKCEPADAAIKPFEMTAVA